MYFFRYRITHPSLKSQIVHSLASMITVFSNKEATSCVDFDSTDWRFTELSHLQWLCECPRHPLSQHALDIRLFSWRHLCLSSFHQWAVTSLAPPFSFLRFSRRLSRHLGCPTFHRIQEKDVSHCVQCKSGQ